MSDHNGFRIPQYEIKIGKGKTDSSLTKLDPKKYPVLSITVNQSLGPASSAQIAFICAYDATKSDFVEKKLYKTLEPGQTINIKMGYKKPVSVFFGITASISTNFTPSGVIVAITCYDAKMALFHQVRWIQHEKEPSIKKTVEAVLKPCLEYGKIMVISTEYEDAVEKGQVTALFQDNIDDYRYLMRLAALTNSSFYAREGTVFFVENLMDKAETKVKLGWGTGLMSFSVDVDISGQIGSVELAYRTGARKEEIVTYSGDDIKGDGDLAADNSKLVEKKVVEKTDVNAKNKKQAMITAKNWFLQSAMNYVIGRGSTIGLPEIAAGTLIELTGIGDYMEGKYFLTQVTHQFDAGGFLTNFTCQKAKI